MCAILDASVVSQVFGSNQPLAGKDFHNWINTGSGRLVIGGKLRRELARTRARLWLQAAIRSGRLKQLNDNQVNEKTKQLQDAAACKSDDHHVIALAQLSGARLLYSNDCDLREDFKNKELIEPAGGILYPKGDSKTAQRNRKKLFAIKHLCSSKK